MSVGATSTFELGVLTASAQGSGLALPRQSHELWIAAAVLAQGEVPLGGGWRVGAYGGAQLHPLRYIFQVTPFDVYRASLVGLYAGVSISFRLD